MAHRRRWWTCFTSGTVNFVNNSSGSATPGACGCPEGVENDAFRGGHGEVGVRKLGKGDNCGFPLENWCIPGDKGGRGEAETVDDCRAMRVGVGFQAKDGGRERGAGHRRRTVTHSRRQAIHNTVMLRQTPASLSFHIMSPA